MVNIVISNVRNNPDGSAYIKTGNVGDICSYYILKHLTGLTVNPVNLKSPRPSEGIVMVGSTLDLFFKMFSKGTVIGTGSIRDRLKVPPGEFNFLGVRGHLTSDLIRTQTGQKVEVLSDLGLLLSKVFPCPDKFDFTSSIHFPDTFPDMVSGNITSESTFDLSGHEPDIGYIIHSVDREAFFTQYPELQPYLVNNYTSPETFVNQLTQYKYIVSSSLHGLIFAHAYGIPSVGIKVTDKIIGGEFKYRDYYSSLGYDYPGRLNCPTFNSLFEWKDLVQEAWNPSRGLIKQLQSNQLSVLSEFASSQTYPGTVK